LHQSQAINIWLPSSTVIPTAFFDKTIITELKGKLGLLRDILANKVFMPDHEMQVIQYENR